MSWFRRRDASAILFKGEGCPVLAKVRHSVCRPPPPLGRGPVAAGAHGEQIDLKTPPSECSVRSGRATLWLLDQLARPLMFGLVVTEQTMNRHAATKADVEHYQDALELGTHKIQSELRGRTSSEVYELCFSRLTKPDPFLLFPSAPKRGRTNLMIGTDQRDLFVPVLKRQSMLLRSGDHIVDLGCGDGQTSRFLWERIGHPCTVTLVDPSAAYVAAHARAIELLPTPSVRQRITEPMDVWLAASQGKQAQKTDSPLKLVLMLHSIYFSQNLEDLLNHLLSSLSKGGRILIVFADEFSGYTGTIIRRYIKETRVANVSYVEEISLRHKVFGIKDGSFSKESCQKALRAALHREDLSVGLATKQESRIYGNDFADLLAAAFITGLETVGSEPLSKKLEFVSDLLRRAPHLVDLSLEVSGTRRRMMSVKQPQFVLTIDKLG